EDLRDARAERGVDVRQLRPLPGRLQELLEAVAEQLHAAAAPVLQPEREAACAADARDRGRREREGDGLGDPGAQRPVDGGLDLGRAEARRPPLAPRLQLHEEERGVRGRGPREQAEAVDGDDTLHGFSSSAESAGERLRALKAEMTTAMAIVTANCWLRRPWIPPMSAMGMKTADRTRAIPTTGPETSDMALSVASRGERPSS